MTAKLKGVLARAIGLRTKGCTPPYLWYIYSQF